MAKFYTEQVQIVRPVKVSDKYNPPDGEMLSWEGGATPPGAVRCRGAAPPHSVRDR